MGYAGLQPGDPHEIGPYRVLGQLGNGGMGQVFLGMSPDSRPIAVKVIRADLAADAGFRTRLRREVAAAQKVSGMFTAIVVDADLDGSTPWLATAYVAGPSLAEAVHRHGPLPTRTLLALAAGLAEGLNAIHSAEVVHGDLKPSNVLLAEDGPRIIDFGISQAAEAGAATSGSLVTGSSGFMSPEQVLGYDIGPPSDVFSLGAVLTFAATGEGPFGSGSDAALMYRLVNGTPDVSSVPRELRSLVGNCLARQPGDRPPARELLAQAGAIQPAPGWIDGSIVSGFGPDQLPAGLFGQTDADNDSAPAAAVASAPAAAVASAPAAAAASGQPPSGHPDGPGRHRVSRPLASACLSGGLLVASAVAAFAMIGANRAPTAPHAGTQPQAGAGVAATAPAPAAAASTIPRGPRASSATPPSAVSSGLIAPNAFLSPSASSFLSPSVTPSLVSSPTAGPPTSPASGPPSSPAPGPPSSPAPGPPSSPASGPPSSPAPGPTTSSTAQPSKSASPSASASKSPSPSSSPSASPSSSPPKSPSASPSASSASASSSPSKSSSPSAAATAAASTSAAPGM